MAIQTWWASSCHWALTIAQDKTSFPPPPPSSTHTHTHSHACTHYQIRPESALCLLDVCFWGICRQTFISADEQENDTWALFRFFLFLCRSWHFLCMVPPAHYPTLCPPPSPCMLHFRRRWIVSELSCSAKRCTVSQTPMSADSQWKSLCVWVRARACLYNAAHTKGQETARSHLLTRSLPPGWLCPCQAQLSGERCVCVMRGRGRGEGVGGGGSAKCMLSINNGLSRSRHIILGKYACVRVGEGGGGASVKCMLW